MCAVLKYLFMFYNKIGFILLCFQEEELFQTENTNLEKEITELKSELSRLSIILAKHHCVMAKSPFSDISGS